MRVLILDDSRAMRSLLGRLLGELGFEVSQAPDGKKGLEELERVGAVDLVLVDWNMPEMDGLSFVNHVRGNRDYDAMKLVMVTTETEREKVAIALEAGVNEYIMKPFTKEVLQDKLGLLGLGD